MVVEMAIISNVKSLHNLYGKKLLEAQRYNYLNFK